MGRIGVSSKKNKNKQKQLLVDTKVIIKPISSSSTDAEHAYPVASASFRHGG